MKNAIYSCLIILILGSCELQKRKYQSGYYTHFAFKQHNELKHKSQLGFHQVGKLPPDSCSTLVFADGTRIKAYVVSDNGIELKYRYCDGDSKIRKTQRKAVTSVLPPGLPTVAETKTFVPQSLNEVTVAPVQEAIIPSTVATVSARSCDILIYKNGMEDSVFVKEVGIGEIRYKRCDMPEGPDFVKKKSEVFMIKYAGRKNEVIKQEELPKPVSVQPSVRYVERKTGLATLSVTMASLGLWLLPFVGSVLGVVFGAIYIKDHQADPEKYPAIEKARAGLITGISTLGIIVLILLLVILL